MAEGYQLVLLPVHKERGARHIGDEINVAESIAHHVLQKTASLFTDNISDRFEG